MEPANTVPFFPSARPRALGASAHRLIVNPGGNLILSRGKQQLKLMIHSLYSNKEIFLRELISNASDAADKLRFEGLADGALYETDPDLKIRISYDAAARTLTIADNGTGMSRQEGIEHIGTIAKSGT